MIFIFFFIVFSTINFNLAYKTCAVFDLYIFVFYFKNIMLTCRMGVDVWKSSDPHSCFRWELIATENSLCPSETLKIIISLHYRWNLWTLRNFVLSCIYTYIHKNKSCVFKRLKSKMCFVFTANNSNIVLFICIYRGRFNFQYYRILINY